MAEMSAKDQDGRSISITQCPECLTGVMHIRHLTYFTWLDQELITVPNFPAWVCDLCGRREYDPRAVKWLNAILGPETSRSVAKPRRDSPGTGPLPSQT
jgi:YgiT-type zinc finger domain-containing protein